MVRRRLGRRVWVIAIAALVASGAVVLAPATTSPAGATTWNSPVVVSGAGQWRAAALVVSQGADTTYPHACAVTTLGGVKCWGHLQYGEGGFGGQIATATYPVNMKLVGTSPVARVSQANGPTIATGGDRNTCVLYDASGVTGGVQCSGLNRSGAVGRGDVTENVLSPVLATKNSDSTALTGVTAIVGGGYDDANQHFCALKNGGVYCWGYGANGQLGDNANVQRTRAVVAIPEGSGVTQIAAGSAHSCAVYTSGSTITLTGGSTLAAATGGAACWGYNPYGALGDNSVTARAVPVRVLSAAGTPLANVAQISAGVWHTCARMVDGTMRCWGHNGQGMLGIGNTTDHAMADTTVSGISGVTSIGAGYRGSCAVIAGGELRCWGQNSNGQLGDGTTTDRSSAAKVVDVGQPSSSNTLLGQMGSVSMGSYVTCGVKTDGRALCWGRWDNGTLGNGSTANVSAPTYVNGAGPGLWSAATVQVSSRGDDTNAHGCAITTQPLLKCWGYNTDGQAGVAAGGTIDAPTTIPLDASGAGANPAPVATITDGAAIAASNIHTCVIFNSATITGGVQCFGLNTDGQLGQNNLTAAPGVRKLVLAGAGPSTGGALSGVTQISASGREDQGSTGTTCAVAGGGVYCWGNGDPGLMGDGTATDRSTPVQVPGFPAGSGAAEVSVGRYHACARYGSGTNVGKAKCWGWNAWGQLADGNVVTGYTPSSTFVKSAAGVDMTGIDQIAVGAYSTCFLRSGAVSCAGYGGQGELGLGSANLPGSTTYPVAAVAPMNSGVTAISTGTRFTCAVKATTPYCVGKNSEGQLGRGTTTAQEYAWSQVVAAGETSGSTTAMSGLPTTKGAAISAGAAMACARSASGEVDCWGYEASGQLGDGSVTGTPTATFSGLSCNTASTSTWGSATAPAGTGSATFYLTGGGGAGGDTSEGIGGAGGPGGVISATVPVTAGDVLWAKLGCGGTDGTVQADGYTKGGTAGSVLAGGGGGSSVLCVGTATASCGSGKVVAIAAGGGGGGRGSGTGACRNVNGGDGGSANLGSSSTGQNGGTGYGGGRGGNGDFDRATSSLTYPSANGGGGGGGLGQGPGQATGTNTPNNTGGTAGTGTNGNGANGAGATSNPPGPSPVSSEGNGGAGVAGANTIYSGGGGGGYTGGGSGAGGIDGTCASSVWAGGGGGGAGSSWIRTGSPTVTTTGAGQGFSNAGGLNGSCADTLGVNAGYGATAGSGARGCHGNIVVYWNQDVSTISGAATPAANGVGWNNTDVTVTYTCVSTIAVSCTAPVVLSSEGAGQSSTGTVTDGYGRSSSTTVSGIKIDKTNPTGSGAATAGPNGTNGWYTGNATIAWTCADALSGVASCPANSTITGEGASLTATGTVTDVASNSAGLTSPAVKIDRTAPSTSVSAIPTWSTSNATISLTPSDNLSGVASTTYTVDGGASQTGTSVSITTDGVHSLTYRSTDGAGNVEAVRSATVQIDKTAPTISAGRSPAPNAGGWNNADVTVTFTCSDGTSGVASCTAPSTVTTESASTLVEGNALDVAGNSSGTTAAVKLDKTAPTISGSASPAPNAAGWNNTNVDVSFTCNDGLSGIATCPSASTLAGNGALQSVAGSAVDAADNSSPASVSGINIDKTAPVISASVSGSANAAGFRAPPVTVSFTCSDALSGVDVGTCPDPVVLTGSGTHQVDGAVLDVAGNSAATSVTVKVAGSVPTISGDRTPEANGNGWNNEPVTVTFTCGSTDLASCTAPTTLAGDGAGQSVTGTATDNFGQSSSTTVGGINIDQVSPNLAGVASTAPNGAGWYRSPVDMIWTCSDALSGISAGVCPEPTPTVGEGTAVSVTESVNDKAGNLVTATSESVMIDATAPSTGVSSPPTWSHDDVTLTLSASDALSGVASTSYRIDGGSDQTGTHPVVSGQGHHVVTYWSTDAAGNEESHSSVGVNIDTTAPSITPHVSPAPNGAGWHKVDVDVTFSCGDADSGIATCTGDQSFTSQVDTVVTGNASDNAGNTASAQATVRIDKTDPTVTAQVPPANAHGWFDAEVQVPFSCTDTGGSGIASCPAPAMFAGEGADQPVTATGYDNAGNAGSASGDTVSVDLTAPTISGAATNGSNGNGGYYGTVTIHWTCDDALSGIVACPADQTLSGEGVRTASASVNDKAGNTSSASVTLRIDHDPSTDPGIVHGTITDAATGQPVKGALVGLAAATLQLTTLYSTKTGTDGTYTFPIVADGSYKMYVNNYGVHLQAWYPNKGRDLDAPAITIAHGTNLTANQALTPGYVLSGNLTSSTTGQPISGATVRVQGGGAEYSATSDAAGNYAVTGMVAGSRTVTFLAYGSAPVSVAASIPATATMNRALVPSAASPGVKGTITALTLNGLPLGGATVRVWVKGGTTIAVKTSTGTDGRFTFPTMPVGQYEIDVVRGDYQVRWFGDTLSRSGATTIALTTSCTSTPDPAWGDACASPVNIRMLKP